MVLIRSLLTGLLLLSILYSTAQQVRINVSAKPYNAIMIVDEDTIGIADDQSTHIGFNAAKNITSHVVKIAANGYVTYVDTITIDTSKAIDLDIKLKRELPSLIGTPEYTIGLHELVSGLEYGTQLSSSERWKYRYDDHLDFDKRDAKIQSALKDMGFNSIEPRSDVLPDVQIKARIEAYSINKNPSFEASGAKVMDYTSMLMVHWQFYDRHNHKTVCRQSMTSKFDYDFEYRQDALYNAIIDNFYLLFNTHKDVLDSLQQFNPKSEIELHTETNDDPPVESRDEMAQDTLDKSDSTQSTGSDSLKVLSPIVIDSQPTLKSNHEDTKLFVSKVLLKKPQAYASTSLAKVKNRINRASVILKRNGQDISVGTVISENGYILTTYISQNSDDQIEVVFENGIRLDAKEVEAAKSFGLAIFKVDASELIAQPIHQNSEMTFPLPAFSMVPSGDHKAWIAIDGEVLELVTIDGINALKFSASLSTSLKGCALFNSKGEVIGLVNNELGKQADDEFEYAVDHKYIFNVLGIAYE